VEPARVVEIMGLMGDAADNIPGVKGIGEKTAMKLIAQFGTIEELLRRVEEVTLTPRRGGHAASDQSPVDRPGRARPSQPAAGDHPAG